MRGWRCALVITTADCRYDFSRIEAAGATVLRVDPKKDLRTGGAGYEAIVAANCEAVFHYGWSWIVPEALCQRCPNVTLHPGKLPRDRGGSPIQNQIRNGESWSYANIIELVPGLDEGRIYRRLKFSLDGEEADAVWARMVTAGIVLSRQFLDDVAEGKAIPVPQDTTVEPTIYKRVSAAQSQVNPGEHTARFIYDVVRAHNETDPNTYVRPAYLALGTRELVLLRASLTPPPGAEIARLEDIDWAGDEAFSVCYDVDNGAAAIGMTAADKALVYVTRCRLRQALPASN